MIERQIATTLTELIDTNPAVALIGPRQVGKTALTLAIAEERQSIYLDLESDADLAKLSEPDLYLGQHTDKLVILDEVHRLPNLFQSLRGLIDRGWRAGRRSAPFLLLGSASIDLLQQSGETLAGRIAHLEMHPIDGLEVAEKDIDPLWLPRRQRLGPFSFAVILKVSNLRLLAVSLHELVVQAFDFLRDEVDKPARNRLVESELRTGFCVTHLPKHQTVRNELRRVNGQKCTLLPA